MKKMLYLLIAAFSISCANIANDRLQPVDVYVNNACEIAYGMDTTACREKHTLMIKRSSEEQKLIFISDSLEKTITLSSSWSAEFIWGNIYPIPIITHFIDAMIDDEKIYAYDNEIYVDMENNEDDYETINLWEDKENSCFFNIYMPEGNIFLLNNAQNKTIRKFGFLGIGAGLDYYYTPKKYISLNLEGVIDFPLPIPLPMDFEGTPEATSSAIVSLQDFYDFGRLQLGYGIQFSYFFDRDVRSSFTDIYPNEIINVTAYNALGAALTANWLISKKWKIGLNYKPSLFRLGAGSKFEYSHLINFEFQRYFNLF